MEAIYLTEPSNACAAIVLADGGELNEFASALNFRPLSPQWKVRQFELHRDSPAEQDPDISCVYFGGIVAFKAELKHLVFPAAGASLEFLPIRVAGAEWLLLNCLQYIGGIDEARSKVARDPGGQIFMIMSLTVPIDCVDRYELFTLDGSNRANLIVRGAFKERVENLGLKGLGFRPIGSLV